jgi:hypothetical protein
MLANAQASLLFDVIDPDRVVQAPATETFVGSITNGTGDPLFTTDIFVNFSGYDPFLVTVEQLLGDPDIPLPDGSTTSGLALFRISLDASALPDTTYFVDVQLEDVSSNLSDILTVSLRNSAAAAPEPNALTLLIAALVSLVAGRRYRALFQPRHGD